MADTKKKKPASQRGATTDKPHKGEKSNKGMKQGAESILYLVVVLIALVLANVVVYRINARFDLTEANRFSLSQGSERLVSDLEDTLEIRAYFTADLPPPFNETERYVRHILEEYEAASGGQVNVVFIDPDESTEIEQAEADGVPEVQHRQANSRSASLSNGYRGIAIHYLGNKQTIPMVQDTRGLEYEITSRIRLLVRDPLPVGVVGGHGSPTLTEGLSRLRGALPSYELREVNVAEAIDPDLRALLIVNPAERFTDVELRRINEYVMNGGSLGIFGGSMNTSLEGAGPSATAVDTGLNGLLERWGIRLGDGLVADANCIQVPMRTQFGIALPVQYPPVPVIFFDEDEREHPVLFRLHQAPFFFTSPITTTDAFARLDGHVLGQSSERASWLLTGATIPVQPRNPREWPITDQRGPHIVMAALENTLPSAFTATPVTPDAPGSGIDAPAESTEVVRVLVAGSGALLRDEFLPSEEQSAQQMTGGLALALNAVDWLAADSDLIAIRAKNIEDPRIDVPQEVRTAREATAEAEAEAQETGDAAAAEAAGAAQEAVEAGWDKKKLFYQLFAVTGPPLLLLLFGVVRWQLRKNKRANLQELRKKLTAKKR